MHITSGILIAEAPMLAACTIAHCLDTLSIFLRRLRVFVPSVRVT